MKKMRFFGIIALATVIGFSIAACSGGGTGDGGNNNEPDPVTPVDPGTKTPVASDYEIGNLFQYEDSVTVVTITPKQGKSTGVITIYYNGSTTLPIAVGTYTVAFNVAAASGWNAASGLAGGTLTINPRNQSGNQNPIAADYTISGTGTYTYNGTGRTVTVTPKQGKSTGTVTVYYNESTTAPSDAGSYTVTFNVAAVSGWNAASELEGGTLTINKVSGAAINTPTLNTRTHNSITINAVTAPGTGQSVEYGISTSSYTSPAVWQSTLAFNGLTQNTTYYILARSAGNNNYETGAASSRLTVTTLQAVSGDRIEYYWVDQHGSLITTSGGTITIAAGATLTITAQSTGYVVKQWHLNGTITSQSGDTYNFSSAAAGIYIVSLFVEKDGKLYNTNITIMVVVANGSEVNPFPLTANTWANGSITSTASGSAVWYSFNVTSGTIYYVWWNDSYSGNATKTLDVKVSAYYSSGTSIFAGTDSGWTSPRQFTASSSTTVKIKVEPYSSGYTGTFAVVYGNSSTRPQ